MSERPFLAEKGLIHRQQRDETHLRTAPFGNGGQESLTRCRVFD